MVRKIFSPFLAVCWKPSFAQFILISLRYRSQFAFFKLKLVQWGMGLIVRSIRKLMRIGRWSDANETSGKDGLAWPGSLVDESQLRIPK